MRIKTSLQGGVGTQLAFTRNYELAPVARHLTYCSEQHVLPGDYIVRSVPGLDNLEVLEVAEIYNRQMRTCPAPEGVLEKIEEKHPNLRRWFAEGDRRIPREMCPMTLLEQKTVERLEHLSTKYGVKIDISRGYPSLDSIQIKPSKEGVRFERFLEKAPPKGVVREVYGSDGKGEAGLLRKTSAFSFSTPARSDRIWPYLVVVDYGAGGWPKRAHVYRVKRSIFGLLRSIFLKRRR